jgi:Cytochrome c
VRRAGGSALWLLAVLVAASGTLAAPPERGVPGAGERLYREGILRSGQPAKAVVAGDVPMLGRQAACVSCHRRSGMGSIEGGVVAPPVTEAALYAPVVRSPRNRPPYTDEALARAIRDGVDPAGQSLDRSMPRFDLPEADMAGLIAYLKTLSAEISPGVTKETIHFATVTAEGTDASPMLAVLNAFFEDKNRQTRNETSRAESGPFYLRSVNRAYRKWVLHPWALVGPPENWQRQLEAHYREQPVFAMVSGAGRGTWQPVHQFCERNHIPCLLPNTDLPVVASDDYYTVYFSEGVTLEARAIAAHLMKRHASGRIVEVFRDEAAGKTASEALGRALADRRDVSVTQLALREDGASAADRIAGVLAGAEVTALVAWLPRGDIMALEAAVARSHVRAVYLSSTQLGGDASALPTGLPARSFVAHPSALPSDFRQRFRIIEPWLRRRGIPITDERLLAQTYFACHVVADSLMHITADYFYRDYLLELVDHLDAAARFSIAHPSPSFGPGQRYISKGCYVLDLARGDGQGTRDTTWIVP